jgi:hypothetical protein
MSILSDGINPTKWQEEEEETTRKRKGPTGVEDIYGGVIGSKSDKLRARSRWLCLKEGKRHLLSIHSTNHFTAFSQAVLAVITLGIISSSAHGDREAQRGAGICLGSHTSPLLISWCCHL